MSLSRRSFLATSAAGLLLPRVALGFGEASQVDVGQLDLGRGSLLRPDAWVRLLYEIEVAASVECVPRAARVSPDSPELFVHPFCTLVGSDHFDQPNAEALAQLSRFLSYGGFLYIDETTGAERSPFDASVRSLCERLFPTRPLAPLPSDHSIYRSFFLIDEPMGRLARFPYLEGITVGNLTPLVYGRNDLSGALERGDDGRHRASCVPGGEQQRREAVKLGINLVLYSLTANYKKDQAHVRELMREGKLE